MATLNPTTRPDYISPDWFRCTNGMAFVAPPPDRIRAASTMASPNLWERVACVTLQAQLGDFRNVERLLEIIEVGPDDHLRDCAVRVFALAAPSNVVGELKRAFDHSSYETRVEAYRAASLTGNLALAQALAVRRRLVQRDERDLVMDNISDILEPDGEDIELAESALDGPTFERRVAEFVTTLQDRHGTGISIYQGLPVDASNVVRTIAGLCGGDEPEQQGGTMAGLLCLLEGMTGVPYGGCFDDDCWPVMPKISHTLNRLRQSGILQKLEPGRRYFFGHRIP